MLDLAHAAARSSPAEAPARRSTLVGISAGAATIHLYVVPEHLKEYWPFAVFFAGVAAFQPPGPSRFSHDHSAACMESVPWPALGSSHCGPSPGPADCPSAPKPGIPKGPLC